MPITKNATIRYQILDRCFRNTGRNYTLDNLLETVNKTLTDINPDGGIKRRQLYDDIKFMESSEGFSAEIERIPFGKKKTYRYRDPKFSIRNEPINEIEAEYMRSAIHILSRFSGAPQFAWVEEILPMLETKFGIAKNKSEIISYESNVDYLGNQYIQPLFNAIHHQRVLKIVYKPFPLPKMCFDFHPYYLKQFNNRWFVFGWNAAEKIETWNMALDRIISLEETGKTYRKMPNQWDWEDYFYDIVGVSRPFEEDPKEVKLLFNEAEEPYVLTKPIHPTQKTKKTAQGLEVRIKVIPNFELEKLILSYGSRVKVLAPESFKSKIIKRLTAAKKQYL